MYDRAKKEFSKARTALADATTLRDGGGSDEAIINRLYYACFHAAQAVLYTEGYNPTTHDAVVRLFGRELVNAERAAKSDGRFLSEMKELRNDADYGHSGLDVDVDAMAVRTETFVESMDELLNS